MYCEEMYFLMNIYKAMDRRQKLKDVRNMYIRLSDYKTGRVLVEYRVDQGMEGKTGIVIGKAYRTGSNWKFKAIGKGVSIEHVREFEKNCND
ncbi:MAG: TerD family protein [Candidatus Ventricola sp.]|nr:TerD family protein [Candidatus Ventricola sp.]